MVELPNDEDFAPCLSFSVKPSLGVYVELDDYVLTVNGSICTDDDTEIGGDCSDISFQCKIAPQTKSRIFLNMRRSQSNLPRLL